MSNGYQTYIPPSYRQNSQQNGQASMGLSKKQITLYLGLAGLIVTGTIGILTSLSPHFQAEIRRFLGYGPVPPTIAVQPVQPLDTVSIPYPPLPPNKERRIEIVIEEKSPPIINIPKLEKEQEIQITGEWAILDHAVPEAHEIHRRVFFRIGSDNQVDIFNTFDQKIGWGTFSSGQINGVWLVQNKKQKTVEGRFDAKIVNNKKIIGTWVSKDAELEIELYRP